MLKIRAKQREILDHLDLERFLRDADELLATRHPHIAALDTDARAQWIASRVARAGELGLRDEGAVLRWLDAVAIHGEAAAEDRLVVVEIAGVEARVPLAHARARVARVVVANALARSL